MDVPDELGLDYDTVWEVTTEHGTRLILDLRDERRWMRVPALSEDGRLNLTGSDGRWQRLACAVPVDYPTTVLGVRVRIGSPLRIHVGMREWWTTTRVVSVRELAETEVPSELPRTLDDVDDEDDDWPDEEE